MVVEMNLVPGLLHGEVGGGYGAAADASRRNSADRREIGAACVFHRHGREVVDRRWSEGRA
jgi:hypothetical protein